MWARSPDAIDATMAALEAATDEAFNVRADAPASRAWEPTSALASWPNSEMAVGSCRCPRS